MNDCICYGRDNMSVIIIGFLHGLEKEQWLEKICRKYEILHIISSEKMKNKKNP